MAGSEERVCDLLIRGGRLIDGSGAAAVAGDLAIAGERIVGLGELSGWRAAETVSAEGLAVAPGFIDVHTHDDRALLVDPAMTPKVSQGVTTVVVGNCGASLAPARFEEMPPQPLNLLGGPEDYRFPTFAAYRAALEERPPAVNAAALVGHTTLRSQVMAELDRPAEEGEIERMSLLLEEALDAGAVGFSTGLGYPPAEAAPTAEVIALARVAASRGRLHTTHMRDERGHVVESVAETIEIARATGVRTVISHHKCSGRPNWGLVAKTLPLIEAARRELALDLDAYPYTASSTVLLEPMVEAAERVMIAWSKPHPEAGGRDLAELAAEWGVDKPEALRRLKPGGGIYFQMDEADVRRVLAFPPTMVGSDGLPHDTFPHPRLWGTFPRVLGHYVREVGLLGLEQAVHKMTGRSAAVFGLEGRGILAVGAFADVVVFDPATVIDRATFEQPMVPAAGIELVLVNGRPSWRAGAAVEGPRAGRFLAAA